VEMETELPAVYQQMDLPTQNFAQRQAAQIRSSMRHVAENIIAIGEILLETKKHLPHGMFGRWLQDEFSWSDQTALNFMNVARQAKENPNFWENAHHLPTTALYMLAAPSTPDAAREQILSLVETGEHITANQVKTIIATHKTSSVSDWTIASEDRDGLAVFWAERGDERTEVVTSWDDAETAARYRWQQSDAQSDPGTLAPATVSERAAPSTLRSDLMAEGWLLSAEPQYNSPAPRYMAWKVLRVGGQEHVLRTPPCGALHDVEAATEALRHVELVPSKEAKQQHWLILHDHQREEWWIESERGYGYRQSVRYATQEELLEHERLLESIKSLPWRVHRQDDGTWVADPHIYGKQVLTRATLQELVQLLQAKEKGGNKTLEASLKLTTPPPERHEPLVPWVLYVSARQSLYTLPNVARYSVLYHTGSTVRLDPDTPDNKLIDGGGSSRQHSTIWCVRDEECWGEICGRYATFRAALDVLADVLRSCGSYTMRLTEAGGWKVAPNPLTPTVIAAPDPDDVAGSSWSWGLWHIPVISRERVERHTEHTLYYPGSAGGTSQHNHFVCPDAATWERVSSSYRELIRARCAWLDILDQCQTYAAALGTVDAASPLVAIIQSSEARELKQQGWTFESTPSGFIIAEHAERGLRLVEQSVHEAARAIAVLGYAQPTSTEGRDASQVPMLPPVENSNQEHAGDVPDARILHALTQRIDAIADRGFIDLLGLLLNVDGDSGDSEVIAQALLTQPAANWPSMQFALRSILGIEEVEA
jgi:Protein of unknown function (DUF3102)